MSTIREDFNRVLAARACLEASTGLPSRIYNCCVYGDECQVFVEKHLYTIGALLDRLEKPDEVRVA